MPWLSCDPFPDDPGLPGLTGSPRVILSGGTGSWFPEGWPCLIYCPKPVSNSKPVRASRTILYKYFCQTASGSASLKPMETGLRLLTEEYRYFCTRSLCSGFTTYSGSLTLFVVKEYMTGIVGMGSLLLLVNLWAPFRKGSRKPNSGNLLEKIKDFKDELECLQILVSVQFVSISYKTSVKIFKSRKKHSFKMVVH